MVAEATRGLLLWESCVLVKWEIEKLGLETIGIPPETTRYLDISLLEVNEGVWVSECEGGVVW